MELARGKVVPPLSGSIEQGLGSGQEIAAAFCGKEITGAFRIDSPAGGIDGYNWERIIAPLASGLIASNDVHDQSTCIIHCRKIATWKQKRVFPSHMSMAGLHFAANNHPLRGSPSAGALGIEPEFGASH